MKARIGVVVAVLFSSLGWAGVALPPIRGINVSPGDVEILTSFLTSSYERFSGAKVTAEPAGADELLEATAFGLGEHGGAPILLRVQRHTATGEVLAQAELQIESLDDAPKVCDRLAETLSKRVPLESTQNRHNIAISETKREVRLGTEKILGVKLWFGAPLATGSSFNAIGALEFDGRFEREKYFFEVGAGFIIPAPGGNSSYGGLTAELGASRYLTEGDTSVYAGGGLMPRLIFASGMTSPLNLAPYGQVGLMFDRASSTRLYADLRVAQNILPIQTTSATLAGAATNSYPTELSVHLGIGF